MKPAIAIVLLALMVSGCKSNESHAGGKVSPRVDWLAWQAKRKDSVSGTDGWTTLVARHWLIEGQNFVGSNATNDLIFPRDRAPAAIGSFSRQGRAIRFEAAPGVVATRDGLPVRSADLDSDATNVPTRIVVGSLSFIVIERGARIGLRVRDPQAPARLHFRGLDCFAYEPAWKLEAQFKPFATPTTLRVQDVIGGTQEFPSPGAVVFQYRGNEYRLDVVQEPEEDDYFVIFRDQSAGKSTYGSGRFLYVAKPDSTGRVTIDFNRAYTPPCGFTPFATCPLPPRQNWLPFAIPAGERKPKGPHP